MISSYNIFDTSKSQLSKKEEQGLMNRASEGDQEAKHELVLTNLPFVLHLLRSSRIPTHLFEEAKLASVAAMVSAADNVQANLNSRFVSYAQFWIRKAIADTVRKLGTAAKVSDRAYREGKRSYSFSIDVQKEGHPPFDIEDKTNLESTVIHKVSARKLLAQCSPKEQYIIMNRFGIDTEELTLEETGNRLGVTRKHIYYIEKIALKKMKQFAEVA